MAETGAGYFLGFTSPFFAASADDQMALLEGPFFFTIGSESVLRVSHEQAPIFTDASCSLKPNTCTRHYRLKRT
jgi:hypothetical protein